MTVEYKKRFMSSKEVAIALGVSLNTLTRWRKSGGGPPFIKMKGEQRFKVFYDADGFDAWIIDRKTECSGPKHGPMDGSVNG